MPPIGHTVALGDGRLLVLAEGGTAAYLWNPVTGVWRATEGLNKQRTEFAALRLADGRAMVIGGRNESNQSYSSTYIVDPSTERWSKTGLLGTARTNPSAALLQDGRVLVAGGYYAIEPDYSHDVVPGAILAGYDPNAGNEWFEPRLADVDPPTIGRAMATAELFDPSTGTWSATGPLNYARAGAAAVTLADGRVLILGNVPWAHTGVEGDDRATESAEIFDPTTGRFSLAGRLPRIDRSALEKLGVRVPSSDYSTCYPSGTLVAQDDGGAVLVGHSDDWKHEGWVTRSFRFDATSTEWTEIRQTYASFWDDGGQRTEPEGVRDTAGTMVARLTDGPILVAGGAGPEGWDSTTMAELYDPTTDTWSELPPMPEARRDGSALVLMDGSILIIGGSGTDGPLVSAIRFIPAR